MLGRFTSLLLLFLSVEALAQSNSGHVINGVIRDSVTGRPIESANVFIAASSYGTSSDLNGHFILNGVPRGSFTLIFSRVGYRLKTLGLEIGRLDTVTRNTLLSPQAISLGDVEVSSEDALEWHRNYELFSRILLGQGPNAGQCEITNPDILRFHYDPQTSILLANASLPLHIVNRGLGYSLEVSLSEFNWNIDGDYGYFLVYPLFRPLVPADSEEAMRWQENRKKSYGGSLPHFLRSLIQRRTKEEGFVMRSNISDDGSGLGRYLYPEEIRLEPVPESSLWRWKWFDWLRVDCENESNADGSYIQVERGGLIIDEDGIVEDPMSFKLRGRWARERVGEMLPLDAIRSRFDVPDTTPTQTEYALNDTITVLLARKEWSKASSDCRDLLRRNPRDLFAHYAAAISRRELKHFNEAREHFKALEKIDSTYGDLFYQWALTEDYDDHLLLAIELGIRQLYLHPNDANPLLGVFHIFRHYIALTDPKEATSWLEALDNPYAKFFLAELYRRGKMYSLAEEMDRAVQKENIVPLQAITIALAKLYVAQGHDAQAQEVYWKGVESITSAVDAGCIFDNLKYIVTDEEVKEYAAVASNREWKEYVRRFWNRRNPMPASTENPRLVEHLRRSVAVERNDEYFGNRNWHRNFDQLVGPVLSRASTLNSELNDMGLIYMRHGEPTTILRSRGISEVDIGPQQDPSFGAVAGFPDQMPHAAQTWLYAGDSYSPRYVFFFICWNGATNHWALSTTPPPHPDLVLSLRTLAPEFATYDKLPQSQAALELKEQEMISDGLRTDNTTWGKKVCAIKVAHSVDEFRSEGGETLLDISYAIPLDDLAASLDDHQTPVPIEAGLSILSASGDQLVRRLDTLTMPPAKEMKGSYISLFRYTLAPGPVKIAMHVRTLDGRIVGTWDKTFTIQQFDPREFNASDLQLLLPASGQPSINIDGEKVMQSPFEIYRQNASVFGYEKLYNLIQNADGKVKYSVRYMLMPFGSEDPDDAVELGTIMREHIETEQSAFQRLDLSNVSTGKYTLRVELTDRLRVQTVVRTRAIEVIPGFTRKGDTRRSEDRERR